jgi:5-methylcytosine-specific restriction endonuclease McrA
VSPNYKSNVKRNALAKSGGCCTYCRRQLTMETVTLDHIIPRCRGGRGTQDNLCACCWTCNQRKANLMPQQWQAKLRRFKPVYDEAVA